MFPGINVNLIVLLPMFVVVVLVCVFALRDLGPMRYLAGLCAGVLCVLAAASEPSLLRFVEIPYQALGLSALVVGLVWVMVHIWSMKGQ